MYRTIELADGWNGRIISTQVLFSAFLPSQSFCELTENDTFLSFFFTDVLDGAMITLAMYTMNFAHPGLLLGRVKGLPKVQSKGSGESHLEVKF